MATPNLGLRKPELADTFDLDNDLNANWDLIDADAIARGTSLPGTGVDGHLFYKTDDNRLYIYIE